MTQALGNINLTDFATSSAAVHAKCLICDKPVSSQQRPRTSATAAQNPKMALSQSLPQLYDKHSDAKPNTMKSIVPRLNSPQERVKVASEINILRSSMNPLPEINVSITMYEMIWSCAFLSYFGTICASTGFCGLSPRRCRECEAEWTK
ncbi:hypothetical protein EON64_13575 [archaeon]|nr:MAG: hypothetical protein EON64_13575 [archaeon]